MAAVRKGLALVLLGILLYAIGWFLAVTALPAWTSVLTALVAVAGIGSGLVGLLMVIYGLFTADRPAKTMSQ